MFRPAYRPSHLWAFLISIFLSLYLAFFGFPLTTASPNLAVLIVLSTPIGVSVTLLYTYFRGPSSWEVDERFLRKRRGLAVLGTGVVVTVVTFLRHRSRRRAPPKADD